jgi:hypothetical protein
MYELYHSSNFRNQRSVGYLFDLILNILQKTLVVSSNKTPLDACLYFMTVSLKAKLAIFSLPTHWRKRFINHIKVTAFDCNYGKV